MPRTSILLTLAALLAGCPNDYDLNGDVDPNEDDDDDDDDGEDDETDLTIDPGACGEMNAEALDDIPLNDVCDIPLQEGSFTPVVEWTVAGHQGWGPPVVGNLDDDNGDGTIDQDDIPSVCWVESTGGASSASTASRARSSSRPTGASGTGTASRRWR